MTGTSTTPTVRVSEFTGSIGVNTHIDFDWSSYGNTQRVIDSINYIGVDNLRDSPNSILDVGPFGLWQQVANATGATFNAYVTGGSAAVMTKDLGYMPLLAAQGLLQSIEGGNEADSTFAAINGNSLSATALFQQQVYTVAHALGLPAINMSFGFGWDANPTSGNYGTMGDLSAYADYANAHTYFGNAALPGSTIAALNANANLAAASRPVITTEMGWYTTGNTADPTSVSETVQAKYMLAGLLDAFQQSTTDAHPDVTTKTFLYELLDQQTNPSYTEHNFGLFHADGTPKLAATALHNLNTLLADTGAQNFTATGIDYALSGTLASDHSMLLQHSDGSYWLAVWNETRLTGLNNSTDVTVPDHNVKLTLTSNVANVSIFDPLTGITAIQQVNGARVVDITVPDHAVLIHLTDVAAAPVMESVASAPTVSFSPTAMELAAPASTSVLVNTTQLLGGIQITDAWSQAVGGSFTMNLKVDRGVLSTLDAQGQALSGTNLVLKGTLAEINAELAQLNYKAPGLIGTDMLRMDLWNQVGTYVTKNVTIADTSPYNSADISLSAPASASVNVGTSQALSGLSISNPWSATSAGNMSMTLTSTRGAISVMDADGQMQTGTKLTLIGTLAQLNAELASLTYKAPTTAGADSLRIDVWNQAGNYAGKSLTISDVSPYDKNALTLSAPAAANVNVGGEQLIGACISNPWATTVGGVMTAIVTTTRGTISADVAGQTVSGTKLTLTGTLAQINAQLATLDYHATGTIGSGAVRIDVWNQAGVHADRTIQVSDTSPYSKTDIHVTSPTAATFVMGDAMQAVSGVSISNPWAATSAGTMTAIVKVDRGTIGALDNSGNTLTGSSLKLTGTLAQINAQLATLTYHTPAFTGNDALRVDVWNQVGAHADGTIRITDQSAYDSRAIAVDGPGAIKLANNETLHVPGLFVDNPWAATNSGNLTVRVSADRGTVAMTDANGNPATGSGTHAIQFSGTLAQINAELASLNFHAASTTGSDVLRVDVWNQVGAHAASSIAVQSGTATSATITGTAGDDVLSACLSHNLQGGAGADSFYFTPHNFGMGTNAGHILDFSQTQHDQINLHGFGLTAANFVDGGDFAGAKSFGVDHLSDANGDFTLVRIDTNGDQITDHEIRLEGAHIPLHASDFSFV